jgi:hypothetical protein
MCSDLFVEPEIGDFCDMDRVDRTACRLHRAQLRMGQNHCFGLPRTIDH